MSDRINKATLRDVARVANVSHTSVSLALKGSPRISPARQREIHAVARRLGYIPKAAAQMLRNQKSGYVGLIVQGGDAAGLPRAGPGFSYPILAWFMNACQEKGVRCNVEFLQNKDADAFEPPHQLSAGLVDGVALAGHLDDGLRQWLAKQRQFPWVSIEEPGGHCVISATDEGTERAVKFLVESGHRRMAYCGLNRYTTHRLGIKGFRRAVRRYGVKVPEERFMLLKAPRSAEEARDGTYRWASQLLAQPDRPTAVVCHGVSRAVSVLFAAAHAGVAVPTELSVIAVGTELEANHVTPGITAVEHDFSAITKAALDMLMQRIAGRPVDEPALRISPRLVVRGTTGPIDGKQCAR